METKNIDELYDITLELATSAYSPESALLKNYSFLEESTNFPVLFYKDLDTLYIAFRGTGTDISNFEALGNTISNILTDFATTDPTGLGNYINYYTNFQTVQGNLKAHEGFLSTLAKIYLPLIQRIESYSCKDLIITGHSAGGALSTLFYYLYQNDLKKTKNIRYVVSYGSPRVIYNFQQNIELYEKNCKDLLRVFNLNDVVTYVPFKNNLLFQDNITTGFIHVGKAVCLDSNIQINSLNAFTIECARNNINNIKPLVNLETYKLLYTDKYLDLMSRCLFEGYEKFITDEDVTPSILKAYTLNLNEKLSKLDNYNDKCDVLEPLGVSNILKNSPIGETPEQENITIASIGGAILGFNKISVEAHSLLKYRENITKLISQEIQTRKPIDMEDKEIIFADKVEPVSTEEIIEKLFQKINEEVESGKIVGITENSTSGLIIY